MRALIRWAFRGRGLVWSGRALAYLSQRLHGLVEHSSPCYHQVTVTVTVSQSTEQIRVSPSPNRSINRTTYYPFIHSLLPSYLICTYPCPQSRKKIKKMNR